MKIIRTKSLFTQVVNIIFAVTVFCCSCIFGNAYHRELPEPRYGPPRGMYPPRSHFNYGDRSSNFRHWAQRPILRTPPIFQYGGVVEPHAYSQESDQISDYPRNSYPLRANLNPSNQAPYFRPQFFENPTPLVPKSANFQFLQPLFPNNLKTPPPTFSTTNLDAANFYRQKRLSATTEQENVTNKPSEPIDPIQTPLKNCLSHQCKQSNENSKLCQVHCVLKSIPKSHPLNPSIFKMAKVMNLAIRAICDPVQTSCLDLGWKYFVENSKPVNSFVQWQKKMGINLKQIVYNDLRKMADTLFVQIIKHAQTPLSVFKDLYENSEVKNKPSRSETKISESVNIGCLAVNVQNYANKFVDILTRNPSMIDVLLAGSSFIVNVGKYIPGSHQKAFRTMALANELFINSSCGILYWVGVRGATCDQIGESEIPVKKKTTQPKRGFESCPSIEREIKIYID